MNSGRNIFKKSQKYLGGGVSSPVRAFHAVGGMPVFIRQGKGACVETFDGEHLIDYGLGWGSIILGHADRDVGRAVREAAKRGLYFGTTHVAEIDLAEEICRAISCVQKIRFTVSGTEAVMGALRLARGVTGRKLVIKFENSYHGHADHLLAKAGSGLATYGIPVSDGVPADFLRNTFVLSDNDEEAVEEVFRRHRKDIAAVIVEPVGGNYGVRPANIDFLRSLRRITSRYGALLIADEIITGFRFTYGSFMVQQGIIPDLICLGKIIGGGMPIGAYGGQGALMDHLSPLGRVYQASTFSGHPLSMAAGVATLQKLRSYRRKFGSLTRHAQSVCESLRQLSMVLGVPVVVSQYGSMFSLKFHRDEHFRIFYRSMLAQGVYLAPSQFESNFVSFAHTQEQCCRTIMATGQALVLMDKDIPMGVKSRK